MRIWPVVLTFLFSASLFAAPLCGTYKVQVFVPEKAQGKEVYANPDMVSSTQFNLKNAVPEQYWGRLIEIELTFKSLCLLSCEVEKYKILKAVSPFEKIRVFNHDKKGLVKKTKCERAS